MIINIFIFLKVLILNYVLFKFIFTPDPRASAIGCGASALCVGSEVGVEVGPSSGVEAVA